MMSGVRLNLGILFVMLASACAGLSGSKEPLASAVILPSATTNT